MFKTFGKATNYPVNVFNEVGQSVYNQSYKTIDHPLDLLENSGKLVYGLTEGIVNASSNTVKDILYGTKDTFWKLFGYYFIMNSMIFIH